MALFLSTYIWYILAIFLALLSIGPTTVIWLLLCLSFFLIGFLLVAYRLASERYSLLIQEKLQFKRNQFSVAIPKLVGEVSGGRTKWKIDRQMSGSIPIDEVLQDILDYMYRDYIHQWYHRISDDTQFHYNIRNTMQQIIVAFSERLTNVVRSRDIHLIPYVTTRLVEDFATHIRIYRKALLLLEEPKSDDKIQDLESVFFQVELEMEKSFCMENVCSSAETEKYYLQEVCESLMYLLFPPADFHCKLLRHLIREVIVNFVFIPTINLLTDPDYINQTISWLCRDSTFTSESFLTIVRTSESCDEVESVRQKVVADIARQRGKDTGGEDDMLIKQQLGSLLFVQQLCNTKLHQLKHGINDSEYLFTDTIELDKYLGSGQKLYSLPFNIIMNNNVALPYFIEFVTSIGMQNYLFFYLTVEGYRVSATQQLSALSLTANSYDKFDLETLSDAAMSIYNQYLSPKAICPLKLEEVMAQDVLLAIQAAENMEMIFSDVQSHVYNLMHTDLRCYPAFRKSQLYLKLLVQLDLIRQNNLLNDEMNENDSPSYSNTNSPNGSAEDLRSLSSESMSSGELALCNNDLFSLTAHIINTGICREYGKSFTVYLVSVTKRLNDSSEQSWDVYRRYNDFFDFHNMLLEKFDNLNHLVLPSKKAFDNMNKEFLEKRRVGLNAYLKNLLNANLLKSQNGLLETIYQFLEQIHWEKDKSDISRRVDSIVNPLRSSVRSVGNMVRSMPNNLVDGVVRVSMGVKNIPSNMIDGVGRIINSRPSLDSTPSTASKVEENDRRRMSASLNFEGEDNVPLQVMHMMMLLMDEVFDLKTRNLWLRRRIVALVNTMFGDSINRKIIGHVIKLTSVEQISEYLKIFRDTWWPGGKAAELQLVRDEGTKMRTKVACKAKLLGSLSEELRHLIGSETTRQGVMLMFEMLQRPHLNRRLFYVIFEDLIETLFPDNKFRDIFQKIHSRSEFKKN